MMVFRYFPSIGRLDGIVQHHRMKYVPYWQILSLVKGLTSDLREVTEAKTCLYLYPIMLFIVLQCLHL